MLCFVVTLNDFWCLRQPQATSGFTHAVIITWLFCVVLYYFKLLFSVLASLWLIPTLFNQCGMGMAQYKFFMSETDTDTSICRYKYKSNTFLIH